MSLPKGKVLAHIKPKKFQHPNETDRVILILNEVEDPRKPSCNCSPAAWSLRYELTGNKISFFFST